MSKLTPLHSCHRAAAARLVDFAGWSMPLHYGSQIEEHHAVRRDAGMFDVSHMLPVDVGGPEARAFLRHVLANDVARLTEPGRALYCCLLHAEGGILDDLIVYRLADERYRLVVNAATAEKDLAWLRAQAGGHAVTIRPRRAAEARADDSLAMLAVQGPQARERFWMAFPAAHAATVALKAFSACEWAVGHSVWLIARTGYTGEDGFEIMLPAAEAPEAWKRLLAAGVRPCGLGARDTLRLEAGMNLYGQDMDESVSPWDCGLGWTVDLRDGNRYFIGREALLARRQTREFVGLVLLEPGVLRAQQKVMTPLGEGVITSGGFSPTLGRSIALARLPLAVEPGSSVRVDIRGRLLVARVVKPPFVRHGQVRIDMAAPDRC